MNHKEKLIFEAIGEASMCWSETPKGIYDSIKATQIANRLLKDLFEYENKVYTPLKSWRDTEPDFNGGQNH